MRFPGIVGKVLRYSAIFFSNGGADSENTGINWRFAHQGAKLIRVAADGSPDAQDGAFERMAFINGLTFLLKGLPSDLDTYEAEQIRSALPITLILKDATSIRSDFVASVPTPQPTSIIHRIVKMIVINLVLLIYFLLSKIQRGLSGDRSKAILNHGQAVNK